MSSVNPAATAPAFTLLEPENAPGALVYASPHSGRLYPSEFLAASKLSRTAIRRSEDAYVDLLISGSPRVGVPVLLGAYARAYLDVNRDVNELDPTMFSGFLPANRTRRTARVAAGLGAVARIVSEGLEIYRGKIPASEALQRIERVHQPYHGRLQALLAAARERTGFHVLLDWHSMPSAALTSGAQADVVLGDRFGLSSRPELIAFVEGELRSLGLNVHRNLPFAGGFTTERYGNPNVGWHALQIELNRGIYLDERRLRLLPRADELKALVSGFTATLKAALDGPLATVFRPAGRTKLAGE